MLAALLASPALAQEQRGSIVGTVRDEVGAAIAGAKVEAESADGLLAATESDHAGRYRFHALQPGGYAVRASAPGRVPSLATEKAPPVYGRSRLPPLSPSATGTTRPFRSTRAIRVTA